MARAGLIAILLLVVVIVALFVFRVIDVRQTREAALPEIRTEGGQLPAFDVDTPDVEVGTRNETVKVPEISVRRADENADEGDQP